MYGIRLAEFHFTILLPDSLCRTVYVEQSIAPHLALGRERRVDVRVAAGSIAVILAGRLGEAEAVDLGRLEPRCEVRGDDAGIVELVRLIAVVLIGGSTKGKGGDGER